MIRLELNLEYHYKNYKLTYDFSLVRGENLTQYEPLSYINPDKDIVILEYKEKIMNYKLRYSNIPDGLKGLGITMVLTGLISLAYLAFSGVQL